MSLRDIYTECFTIDEIIALINAYAMIINNYGDEVCYISKLENLMEALKERMEID